jgi:integrase
METRTKKRPKGTRQVRQERRGGEKRWGYDVWIRAADGSRKRYRDFSFRIRTEAEQALAKLKTVGWKERYGFTSPGKEVPTSLETAVSRYEDLAKLNRISRRTEDTAYWRDQPGHIHTLDRFRKWAETIYKIKYVTEIDDDLIQYWMAAEVTRAQAKGSTLKQATIKRGLNTILAALHSAKHSRKFNDLVNYHVPINPLKKWQVEEDRDRILTDEEITRISRALDSNPDYQEALFFFQLALMTGARFAEIRRMKWDESSTRFGTVKLKATKTGGRVRTNRVPAAAQLIARRREAKLGGPVRVLTKEYEWFKDTLKTVSESLDIPYGQRVQGGWTIHDLRHTCLSNLALEGMPLHAIKEFAGHRNISETVRYLKYMPQQIELGAKVSSKLGLLASAKLEAHAHLSPDEIECPNCAFAFDPGKAKHLQLVRESSCAKVTL